MLYLQPNICCAVQLLRYQCVGIKIKGCCAGGAALLLMSEDDASLVPSIRLSNTIELPAIGLGTFKARGNSLKAIICCAVKCGIRHIDTASVYKVDTSPYAARRYDGADPA